MLAERVCLGSGRAVTVIATAEAGDAEMAARIARHRADRPLQWRTLEEPLDLVAALGQVPVEDTVLIDCLTMWTTNVMLAGWSDDAILSAASETVSLASHRDGLSVVVTNEVGSGIIPMHELSRRYAELLARVNRVWADLSDEVVLTFAGRVAPGLRPEEWLAAKGSR